MSVLKSILHHWNSTSKAYDTLHPETEAAQVTDWHSGIMASLASKTLGTVVDAITTDSVMGKLMKMLLNASGVKYSIDSNGYVCLGSFFGGLIIQWGTFNSVTPGAYITMPLSATPFQVVATDMDAANNPLCLSTVDYDYGKFKAYGRRINSQPNVNLWGHWIAVCK